MNIISLVRLTFIYALAYYITGVVVIGQRYWTVPTFYWTAFECLFERDPIKSANLNRLVNQSGHMSSGDSRCSRRPGHEGVEVGSERGGES